MAAPVPAPTIDTDCGAATPTERATEEGPNASPDYGAAKRILSRHRRDSQISKHPVILHSVNGLLAPHCGRSMACLKKPRKLRPGSSKAEPKSR
jgi:hypothetical protein